MTIEIIRKLNAHIAKGLATEADVTYVLVQLGKLVEREKPKTGYPVLRFYRNWVVHEKLIRMNANPPMRDILDTFETIMQASQAGANITQLAQQVADSVSLRKLERDINQVFDDFPQFDRSLVGRPEHWPAFHRLLLNILADITLEADNSYQLIKELRVDSTNALLDTLLITPRAGQPVSVPLTQ